MNRRWEIRWEWALGHPQLREFTVGVAWAAGQEWFCLSLLVGSLVIEKCEPPLDRLAANVGVARHPGETDASLRQRADDVLLGRPERPPVRRWWARLLGWIW